MSKRLRFIKYFGFFLFGSSLGDLLYGLIHQNFGRLVLAFAFLALTWAYREMYLGYDEEKKVWNFVQR